MTARVHIRKGTLVKLAGEIVADYPDDINAQLDEVRQTQRVLQDGQWVTVGSRDADRFAVVIREVRESRQVEGLLEVLEADPVVPGMMSRSQQYAKMATRAELLSAAAQTLGDCPAGSVVVLKVGQETFELRSYEPDVAQRVDQAMSDKDKVDDEDHLQLSVLEEPADVAAHVAELSSVFTADAYERSCADMWDEDRKLIGGAGVAVLVREGKLSGRHTQVICRKCAEVFVPMYRRKAGDGV